MQLGTVDFKTLVRISTAAAEPITRMNQQHCIRELCQHALPKSSIPHRCTLSRFQIRVQLYSTVGMRRTVIESSEATILSASPRSAEIPEVVSLPNIPKRGLVSLPSIPFPSQSIFFHYYDQRTSADKAPELLYANTIGSANYRLSQIKGKVLGLDLEWRVQGPVNVSLIQICDEHSIVLLHLANMKGPTPS